MAAATAATAGGRGVTDSGGRTGHAPTTGAVAGARVSSSFPPLFSEEMVGDDDSDTEWYSPLASGFSAGAAVLPAACVLTVYAYTTELRRLLYGSPASSRNSNSSSGTVSTATAATSAGKKTKGHSSPSKYEEPQKHTQQQQQEQEQLLQMQHMSLPVTNQQQQFQQHRLAMLQEQERECDFLTSTTTSSHISKTSLPETSTSEATARETATNSPTAPEKPDRGSTLHCSCVIVLNRRTLYQGDKTVRSLGASKRNTLSHTGGGGAGGGAGNINSRKQGVWKSSIATHAAASSLTGMPTIPSLDTSAVPTGSGRFRGGSPSVALAAARAATTSPACFAACGSPAAANSLAAAAASNPSPVASLNSASGGMTCSDGGGVGSFPASGDLASGARAAAYVSAQKDGVQSQFGVSSHDDMSSRPTDASVAAAAAPFHGRHLPHRTTIPPSCTANPITPVGHISPLGAIMQQLDSLCPAALLLLASRVKQRLPAALYAVLNPPDTSTSLVQQEAHSQLQHFNAYSDYHHNHQQQQQGHIYHHHHSERGGGGGYPHYYQRLQPCYRHSQQQTPLQYQYNEHYPLHYPSQRHCSSVQHGNQQPPEQQHQRQRDHHHYHHQQQQQDHWHCQGYQQQQMQHCTQDLRQRRQQHHPWHSTHPHLRTVDQHQQQQQQQQQQWIHQNERHNETSAAPASSDVQKLHAGHPPAPPQRIGPPQQQAQLHHHQQHQQQQHKQHQQDHHRQHVQQCMQSLPQRHGTQTSGVLTAAPDREFLCEGSYQHTDCVTSRHSQKQLLCSTTGTITSENTTSDTVQRSKQDSVSLRPYSVTSEKVVDKAVAVASGDVSKEAAPTARSMSPVVAATTTGTTATEKRPEEVLALPTTEEGQGEGLAPAPVNVCGDDLKDAMQQLEQQLGIMQLRTDLQPLSASLISCPPPPPPPPPARWYGHRGSNSGEFLPSEDHQDYAHQRSRKRLQQQQMHQSAFPTKEQQRQQRSRQQECRPAHSKPPGGPVHEHQPDTQTRHHPEQQSDPVATEAQQQKQPLLLSSVGHPFTSEGRHSMRQETGYEQPQQHCSDLHRPHTLQHPQNQESQYRDLQTGISSPQLPQGQSSQGLRTEQSQGDTFDSAEGGKGAEQHLHTLQQAEKDPEPAAQQEMLIAQHRSCCCQEGCGVNNEEERAQDKLQGTSGGGSQTREVSLQHPSSSSCAGASSSAGSLHAAVEVKSASPTSKHICGNSDGSSRQRCVNSLLRVATEDQLQQQSQQQQQSGQQQQQSDHQHQSTIGEELQIIPSERPHGHRGQQQQSPQQHDQRVREQQQHQQQHVQEEGVESLLRSCEQNEQLPVPPAHVELRPLQEKEDCGIAGSRQLSVKQEQLKRHDVGCDEELQMMKTLGLPVSFASSSSRRKEASSVSETATGAATYLVVPEESSGRRTNAWHSSGDAIDTAERSAPLLTMRPPQQQQLHLAFQQRHYQQGPPTHYVRHQHQQQHRQQHQGVTERHGQWMNGDSAGYVEGFREAGTGDEDHVTSTNLLRFSTGDILASSSSSSRCSQSNVSQEREELWHRSGPCLYPLWPFKRTDVGAWKSVCGNSSCFSESRSSGSRRSNCACGTVADALEQYQRHLNKEHERMRRLMPSAPSTSSSTTTTTDADSVPLHPSKTSKRNGSAGLLCSSSNTRISGMQLWSSRNERSSSSMGTRDLAYKSAGADVRREAEEASTKNEAIREGKEEKAESAAIAAAAPAEATAEGQKEIRSITASLREPEWLNDPSDIAKRLPVSIYATPWHYDAIGNSTESSYYRMPTVRFHRYKEGVLLDDAGWFETTEEAIARYTAEVLHDVAAYAAARAFNSNTTLSGAPPVRVVESAYRSTRSTDNTGKEAGCTTGGSDLTEVNNACKLYHAVNRVPEESLKGPCSSGLEEEVAEATASAVDTSDGERRLQQIIDQEEEAKKEKKQTVGAAVARDSSLRTPETADNGGTPTQYHHQADHQPRSKPDMQASQKQQQQQVERVEETQDVNNAETLTHATAQETGGPVGSNSASSACHSHKTRRPASTTTCLFGAASEPPNETLSPTSPSSVSSSITSADSLYASHIKKGSALVSAKQSAPLRFPTIKDPGPTRADRASVSVFAYDAPKQRPPHIRPRFLNGMWHTETAASAATATSNAASMAACGRPLRESSPPLVVMDCCCGVGGNVIQFACYFDACIGVDCDFLKIALCAHNCSIYNVRENVYLYFDTLQDWLQKRYAARLALRHFRTNEETALTDIGLVGPTPAEKGTPTATNSVASIMRQTAATACCTPESSDSAAEDREASSDGTSPTRVEGTQLTSTSASEAPQTAVLLSGTLLACTQREKPVTLEETAMEGDHRMKEGKRAKRRRHQKRQRHRTQQQQQGKEDMAQSKTETRGDEASENDRSPAAKPECSKARTQGGVVCRETAEEAERSSKWWNSHKGSECYGLPGPREANVCCWCCSEFTSVMCWECRLRELESEVGPSATSVATMCAPPAEAHLCHSGSSDSASPAVTPPTAGKKTELVAGFSGLATAYQSPPPAVQRARVIPPSPSAVAGTGEEAPVSAAVGTEEGVPNISQMMTIDKPTAGGISTVGAAEDVTVSAPSILIGEGDSSGHSDKTEERRHMNQEDMLTADIAWAFMSPPWGGPTYAGRRSPEEKLYSIAAAGGAPGTLPTASAARVAAPPAAGEGSLSANPAARGGPVVGKATAASTDTAKRSGVREAARRVTPAEDAALPFGRGGVSTTADDLVVTSVSAGEVDASPSTGSGNTKTAGDGLSATAVSGSCGTATFDLSSLNAAPESSSCPISPAAPVGDFTDQPSSIPSLVKAAARISRNVCLFLPRSTNVQELAVLAAALGFPLLEVESLCVRSRSCPAPVLAHPKQQQDRRAHHNNSKAAAAFVGPLYRKALLVYLIRDVGPWLAVRGFPSHADSMELAGPCAQSGLTTLSVEAAGATATRAPGCNRTKDSMGEGNMAAQPTNQIVLFPRRDASRVPAYSCYELQPPPELQERPPLLQLPQPQVQHQRQQEDSGGFGSAHSHAVEVEKRGTTQWKNRESLQQSAEKGERLLSGLQKDAQAPGTPCVTDADATLAVKTVEALWDTVLTALEQMLVRVPRLPADEANAVKESTEQPTGALKDYSYRETGAEAPRTRSGPAGVVTKIQAGAAEAAKRDTAQTAGPLTERRATKATETAAAASGQRSATEKFSMGEAAWKAFGDMLTATLLLNQHPEANSTERRRNAYCLDPKTVPTARESVDLHTQPVHSRRTRERRWKREDVINMLRQNVVSLEQVLAAAARVEEIKWQEAVQT